MTKYGSRKTTVDGRRFDSKREAERYSELKLLARAGEISELECQHRIPLDGRDGPLLGKSGRQLKYIADFRYFDHRVKAWVIEDAKGVETEAFKLKRAICAAMGIEVVTV